MAILLRAANNGQFQTLDITLPGDRCLIGNLCEIGIGSILMPGAVLSDGCIRLNL
jgi:acetyltransferase-like isoleucine patch superfamily enzyme